MLTAHLTQLTFVQLFDALPNAVVYYRAIQNELDQLIDFEIDYANPKAYEYLAGEYQLSVGTSVRYGNPQDPTNSDRVFQEMQTVLKTGQSTEFDYFNSLLNEWLLVSRAKSGNGILAIIRTITTTKELEARLHHQSQQLTEQKELLQGILDTSLSNVFVYQAIRAETPNGSPGPILDFDCLLANHQSRRDTIASMGIDPVGKTLFQINPSSEQAGQFNLFCQVTETGQPIQIEQYFPTADRWYNTAITKLNDGCVVTGINITAQKQAELAIIRQAELLKNVLDSSSSGIKAIQAVRNEQGTIEDFTIIAINATGAAIRGRTIADLIGQRILQSFPGLRQAGLFDHYVEVVNTHASKSLQVQYSGIWFEMTIAPFGDGAVITYTNINESIEAKRIIERASIENLRQAELLNGVLDGSANGILALESVHDPENNLIDFTFLAVNEAACKMFGKSASELIGQRILTVYPGNAETGMMAKYINTVQTGKPFATELYYQLDGLNSWYEVSGRKFGDGIVITFRDVLETKELQRAIEQQGAANRQQAELINSVLDSSNSGIIAFQAIRDQTQRIVDFRFLIANQASVALVGRSIEEMIGNTLLTLFPGNLASGLFDIYVHTTQTGEPGRTETYYNHDGLDFWLDISAQKLGDGFVVTFTDVSVVKRASHAVEQAAIASEQQAALLNTVLDNSQTAISLHEAIRDENGRLVNFKTVLANSQAITMWGDLAEAIMNETFFDVATPEQQAVDFAKYVAVVETGEPDLSEFTVGERWLLRLTAKSGDGVVISNIDITQIHQLQEQLEASVIDLQRSNANLEQFAYVASHDLQEPLRKIQAFGDIIKTQYEPVIGAQGADMIHRMQLCAARMQMLIKDVLAYSRVATKQENVSLVDLNEVIREVCEDLETAISDKSALLRIEPLPSVTGDAPQLRQLLQNLLSNALKFAKPGLTPMIDMQSHIVRGSDTNIPIATPDANRLFHLIELRDNGIGFDPQYAERIFQVFQRLHGRTHFDGTGIGLAIAHKVVDNHKGYIAAEGKPDVGATFRILLPVINQAYM